jgi:hypothetical protein
MVLAAWSVELNGGRKMVRCAGLCRNRLRIKPSPCVKLRAIEDDKAPQGISQFLTRSPIATHCAHKLDPCVLISKCPPPSSGSSTPQEPPQLLPPSKTTRLKVHRLLDKARIFVSRSTSHTSPLADSPVRRRWGTRYAPLGGLTARTMSNRFRLQVVPEGRCRPAKAGKGVIHG